MGTDEFPVPISMPTGFANQDLPHHMEMRKSHAVTGPEIYSDILGQAPLDAHMNQVDWTALGRRSDWEG